MYYVVFYTSYIYEEIEGISSFVDYSKHYE